MKHPHVDIVSILYQWLSFQAETVSVELAMTCFFCLSVDTRENSDKENKCLTSASEM